MGTDTIRHAITRQRVALVLVTIRHCRKPKCFRCGKRDEHTAFCIAVSRLRYL